MDPYCLPGDKANHAHYGDMLSILLLTTAVALGTRWPAWHQAAAGFAMAVTAAVAVAWERFSAGGFVTGQLDYGDIQATLLGAVPSCALAVGIAAVLFGPTLPVVVSAATVLAVCVWLLSDDYWRRPF